MKRCCLMTLLALSAAITLAGLSHAPALSTQVAAPKDAEELAKQFTRTVQMIPMRDGVKLHTIVYAPKEHKAPLPFIMMRTPLRHRGGRTASAQGILEGPGGRWLHLRVSGHSRPARVRGAIRDVAAAARSEGRQGHRRRHRHERHHRLAAQERAEQQWPGRHARHQLSRLADGDGPARSAPGAEGGVAAGSAGRHVPRRRLPSQRRLPPQLWLRVRRHDGDRQEERQLRLRSL